MTPDFDPTRVDWNNPDVEYMMKHFKMAAANRDGETAALTKSNEGLRASNEELRRAHSELEAKYEVLAGMHNRLTGKGGVAASGAPAGPGDRAADCVAEAEILASRVEELIGAEYEDADCRRYVKRLRRERGHLFTFLEHDVDYHNNISERGLRPFAASRKIIYGNRSERGAERTKILMSVYETCKMRGVNFYQFIKDYLEGKATEIPAGRKAAPATAAA